MTGRASNSADLKNIEVLIDGQPITAVLFRGPGLDWNRPRHDLASLPFVLQASYAQAAR